MRATLTQMFRFGLVGAFNAGVDFAVFFLSLAALTDSLVIANVLAWIVAVSSSYVLNARYTFAEREPRELRLSDYLAFALTQMGGFLAHTAVLVASAPYLPLALAKLFGIAVGFVVNFSLARAVVFRPRSRG